MISFTDYLKKRKIAKNSEEFKLNFRSRNTKIFNQSSQHTLHHSTSTGLCYKNHSFVLSLFKNHVYFTYKPYQIGN